MDVSSGDIFLYEFLGTGMLVLLGCGVVANAILAGTKGVGVGSSWLLVNFGWGLAVFAGVYVSLQSGAHINPAVTVGLAVEGTTDWEDVPLYILAQLCGAIVGAALAWAANKQHFDLEENAGNKLAVFSTGPQIRNYTWNVITEIIATFVLVYVIIVGIIPGGGTPADLGPLAVALLVVGIGASLGGPTGYAINPARDLGPRIAHFLLPIRGKGDSDWAYSWVPVVGPIIGGILAGLLANAIV